MIYILAFIPETTNVPHILSDLNSIETAIQFTVEEEQGSKPPVLDVLIHRHSGGLKYAVYRKPTNKEDLIHYFSAHSDRVKSGVVIGFYLRALRICSPDFIQEEMTMLSTHSSDSSSLWPCCSASRGRSSRGAEVT